MKSIYWRPQSPSSDAMLAIGLVSMTCLIGMLVYFSEREFSPDETELAAARLAEDCLESIRQERLRLGHAIDDRFDPHHTGILGPPISVSTSKVATLSAKQISVNPNFAAAAVRMLVAAGVEPGDTIAVGWSGSFPALNVAVCAAIETMALKPVVVASALSSQYGANIDDFLWLDMEQHLAESELIGFRSAAMTIGGAADRAMGESSAVLEVVDRLHQRTQVPWLPSNRLRKAVDARMELLDRLSHGRSISAYVNVGGGIASMGGADSSPFLRPGLNRRNAALAKMPDCVARRFAMRGQPVIHLAHARTLAKRYGLNTDVAVVPPAGADAIFQRTRPMQAMAGVLLVMIAAALHAFVVRDYGYRAIDRLLIRLRSSIPRRDYGIAREPSVSQLMV